MRNGNWVCFDCRKAVRHPGWAGPAPRCPGCAQSCFPIGEKVPLPTKTDVRGWKALRAQVSRVVCRRQERDSKERVRRRHAIEQKIVALQARPFSAGRAREIDSLRKLLAELQT
jgi:hypothetical protein